MRGAAARLGPMLRYGGWAAATGVMSMGFQMVAARLLAPYFGSTLLVWALLISTFLGSFSAGAFLGGAISRALDDKRRLLLGALFLGILSYWGIAAFGRPVADYLSLLDWPFFVTCGLASAALFAVPVTVTSMMLPILAEFAYGSFARAGVSAGFIYATSSVGNIVGVLCTAFVLIPLAGVSRLLLLWACVMTVLLTLFALETRRFARNIRSAAARRSA